MGEKIDLQPIIDIANELREEAIPINNRKIKSMCLGLANDLESLAYRYEKSFSTISEIEGGE